MIFDVVFLGRRVFINAALWLYIFVSHFSCTLCRTIILKISEDFDNFKIITGLFYQPIVFHTLIFLHNQVFLA